MERRETIKALLIAAIAGPAIFNACKKSEITEEIEDQGYGRTPEELKRDEELFAEEYLNEDELATIAILCDIILPSSEKGGSASEAEVADFVEFIVKDIPKHQLKLRGGLMWLENESAYRFQKTFAEINEFERLQIVDEIAYPAKASAEFEYGVNFFGLMRFLVVTGYFTTKMGVDDLGYVGNRPNVWDGVPADVLKRHGLSYEPEWLAKCVDQSKRMDIAQWDEKGNLLN